jgi:hypothetical protein
MADGGVLDARYARLAQDGRANVNNFHRGYGIAPLACAAACPRQLTNRDCARMDDTSAVVRVTGLRALAVLLLAAAVGVALVLTLVWAAALLAVLGVVFWLNVVIIPRLARRLAMSRWVLDLVALVALCAGGYLVGAANGTTAGALVWLGGIGAPRAFGLWLRRRVRFAAAPRGMIIEGVSRQRPDRSQLPARPE